MELASPRPDGFLEPEDYLPLVESLVESVWTTDAAGQVRTDSPGWRAYTGQSTDEFLGDGWLNAIHAESRMNVDEQWQQALSSQVPLEVECRLQSPSGMWRWTLLKVIPVHGPGGSVRKWIGTAIDISQKKLSEVTLRQSEVLYSALFNSIDEGFCIIQVLFNEQHEPCNWLFCEVNPAFEKNNGLVDASGKTILEMTPDIEPKWFDIYGRVAVTGEPLRFEEYSDAFGRWFNLYAFRIGEPEQARVAVLFTDVTQQKRSQEVLQALEQRNSFLLDFSDQIRKLIDPVTIQFQAARLLGEFLKANRVGYAQAMEDEELVAVTRHYTHNVPGIEGVYRYIDYGPELLRDMQLGKTVVRADISNDTSLSEAEKKAHESLQLGATVNMPLVKEGKLVAILFVHFQEAHRWTSHEISLIEEIGERIWAAVELGKAYQELQLSSRRKDEFLAMLAHELRNPMAVLRSGIQLLDLTDELNAMAKQTVGMMGRQMQHLVRLVDDLLDMSRITQGKIRLNKERVELGAIVAEVVGAMRAQYDAKGKKLLITRGPSPIYVQGDATRLAQIVSNLLTNGLRYTRDEGQVEVSLETSQDQVMLRVVDNGIGLSKDQLTSIFDLFVQGDNASAHSEGGLGIGLTLVQRLVKMHSGQVEARSVGLGQGSEFLVYLPLAGEEKPAFPVQSLAEKDPGPNKRVVIIEDNADAAAVLSTFLKLRGFEVSTRHDGLSGVDAAAEIVPAIILCDIGMRGMDGYETARLIRQQSWGQSVMLVALTGYGGKENKDRARQAGFDYHFLKPVDLEELVDFLQNGIDPT